MNFSDILEILDTKSSQLSNDQPIKRAVTDTRSSQLFKNSIFFALTSGKKNGHVYIKEAYSKGIRSFIIEEEGQFEELNDVNFAMVNNSLDALQILSESIRDKSGIKIIAITGSNGKTIVKEWLSQLLSSNYKIVKSPKSYNSQIGVPLSVWQISERHNLGIFEAGISQKGEMSSLQKILKPQIGILTNIGSAHDEGFTDREEKLSEKLLLFKDVEKLIVREEEREKVSQLKTNLGIDKIISWGEAKDNDYRVEINWQTNPSIHIDSVEYQVHFSDPASVENICHCIIVALEEGISPDQIQEKLDQLTKLNMRLEVKDGENECVLIDDTYNHDEAGLRVAVEYLAGQYPNMSKSLIISDLKQSGLDIDSQIKLFDEIFEGLDLKHKILIGSAFKNSSDLELKNYLLFDSVDSFVQNLPEFKREVILIKGSRDYHFEKITSKLERKLHGTRLEINLSALSHNLNFFRSMLQPSTKVMVMVKAFAYGLGSREVANLLEFHQVDYLGVAYASEGVELRKLGVNLPIFVMNPTSESLSDCIEYNLEPEIFSFKSLEEFISTTKTKSRVIPIHINIDTGMKRLGFEPKEIEKLGNYLKDSNLHVASIFSHLSSSDDLKERQFTIQQAEIFEKCYTELSNLIEYSPIKHLVNSAGILNFPEFHFDMVRLGIGLYGINNANLENNPLMPIGRLVSEISQIRNISPEDSIGYNRKGKLNSVGRIATIPIGYADGFLRIFGNGHGHVSINNQLAPIVGNVCMDMCMVDVSNIDVNEGDEVIIFGDTPSVDDLANWANTIPYEILTNVSERVKRIYITD